MLLYIDSRQCIIYGRHDLVLDILCKGTDV